MKCKKMYYGFINCYNILDSNREKKKFLQHIFYSNTIWKILNLPANFVQITDDLGEIITSCHDVTDFCCFKWQFWRLNRCFVIEDITVKNYLRVQFLQCSLYKTYYASWNCFIIDQFWPGDQKCSMEKKNSASQ